MKFDLFTPTRTINHHVTFSNYNIKMTKPKKPIECTLQYVMWEEISDWNVKIQILSIIFFRDMQNYNPDLTRWNFLNKKIRSSIILLQFPLKKISKLLFAKKVWRCQTYFLTISNLLKKIKNVAGWRDWFINLRFFQETCGTEPT